MRIYKAIKLPTREVLGESLDSDDAVDFAFDALRENSGNFQKDFDNFLDKEGVEWAIEEETRIPSTVEEWEEEIENDGINTDDFFAVVMDELLNTNEGLEFLNSLARRNSIIFN